MQLYRVTIAMAHQRPKNLIDIPWVIKARDMADALKICKDRLRGVKKRRVFSISKMDI